MEKKDKRKKIRTKKRPDLKGILDKDPPKKIGLKEMKGMKELKEKKKKEPEEETPEVPLEEVNFLSANFLHSWKKSLSEF